MNVFGNALKYTSEGYIKIKLEAKSISPVNSNVKNDGIERTLVTLTVLDSGNGMSAEFLKSKLFKPFSQVRILTLSYMLPCYKSYYNANFSRRM